MSEKHPTLRELMAQLGYKEGALADPRVRRFIGKQTGPKWRRIQQLIRKQARRRAIPR